MGEYGSFNDKRGAKKNKKRQDAMDSITKSPEAAGNLMQLSRKYKNDEDFLLDAIEKQPAVYMYVHKKFKNDPEFVRKAIVRNPDVLGHMGNSEEQSVTDINSAYYYLDLVKGDEEKTERLKKHFSADVINKLEEASRPLDRGSASRRRVKEKANNEPVDKEKEKATSKLWNLIYNSSLDSAVGKNGKTLRTIFEEIYNEAEEVAGADKYDMVMNSLTRELAEQFGAEYVKDLGKQGAALTKLLNDANVDLGKKNVQGQGLAYIFATKSKNPYVWWVLKTNGKLDISDAEMKKIEKVKSADPIFVAEIKKYKEQKENERTTQNATADSAQPVAQQSNENAQVTEQANPKENDGQTEQTVVTSKKETAEGTEKKKGLFERLKALMQQRKSDKKQQKLNKLLIKALKAGEFVKEAVEALIQLGADITDPKIIKGKTKYSYNAQVFLDYQDYLKRETEPVSEATYKLYKLLTKETFDEDDKKEADRLIKVEGANVFKILLPSTRHDKFSPEAEKYIEEKELEKFYTEKAEAELKDKEDVNKQLDYTKEIAELKKFIRNINVKVTTKYKRDSMLELVEKIEKSDYLALLEKELGNVTDIKKKIQNAHDFSSDEEIKMMSAISQLSQIKEDVKNQKLSANCSWEKYIEIVNFIIQNSESSSKEFKDGMINLKKSLEELAQTQQSSEEEKE